MLQQPTNMGCRCHPVKPKWYTSAHFSFSFPSNSSVFFFIFPFFVFLFFSPFRNLIYSFSICSHIQIQEWLWWLWLDGFCCVKKALYLNCHLPAINISQFEAALAVAQCIQGPLLQANNVAQQQEALLECGHPWCGDLFQHICKPAGAAQLLWQCPSTRSTRASEHEWLH